MCEQFGFDWVCVLVKSYTDVTTYYTSVQCDKVTDFW